MTDEVKIPVTHKEKIFLYSNLAASSGSVVLLVTALSVLGQHGDEFNFVRRDISEMRVEQNAQMSDMRLKIQRIETANISLENRIRKLEVHAQDPHARPDAWTATDDKERMIEFREYMKDWITRNFRRQKHYVNEQE